MRISAQNLSELYGEIKHHPTYANFAEELRHINDVGLQERIEISHVLLLSEEDIVSQVLCNLRNRQQSSLKLSRVFEIDDVWPDHSGRKESTKR